MKSGRPLRVLMVVEKLHGLGGAQQQALRLARALGRCGVESRVVTGRWRWSEPRRGEVEGVPVQGLFTAYKGFHLKGLRKLGVYVYLVSLFLHLWLTRKTYDVLHVHSATVSAFAVALMGRWLRKPTIMKVMASGGWSDFKRMRDGTEVPGSARMARRFLLIDRVVCLNAEAEAECRAFGFPPERCFRTPNGFPVKDVVPRGDYRARESLVITFAGRLDPQKSPQVLLEALVETARNLGTLKIEVRILGDGPQRLELERLAERLGVASLVKFLGRVDDVPVHLAVTDIFVLPSLSEGISNALLEAMAHGIACVATSIPGNKDLVRDRECGLLVPTGDPQALAVAILELAREPALRERLGREARRQIVERFDIETVAARYAELYRQLLQPAAVETVSSR